jgi:hypothetical protein
MSLLKFPVTGFVTRVKGKTAAGIGMFGTVYVGSPTDSDAPVTGNAFGLFKTSGTPSNGTSGTYAGLAPKGSILVDVAGTGSVYTYINTNTQASPTWTAQPVTSGAASYTTGTFTGDVLVSKTQSSTTPAVERLLDSEFTISGATVAVTGNGSMAAVRGNMIIGSSSTLNSGYFYGTQGKITGTGGTIAIGSDYYCGILGQLDVAGMTLTSGHIAPVIASWQNTGGSTPTSVGNLIYAESNCPANINAVLQAIANTAYIFDLAVDSGSPSALATTSSSVTNVGTHGWLKIKVSGVDRYIALGDGVT